MFHGRGKYIHENP